MASKQLLPLSFLMIFSSLLHAVEPPGRSYPVGVRNLEYTDGERDMVMSIFYPGQQPSPQAKEMAIPFSKGLHFYENLPIQMSGKPYPLIMFSHGREGDRFNQAWLAQYLASKGYMVAAIDHYAANSYVYSSEYGQSKLWQRPKDIIYAITYLLENKEWGKLIDSNKIAAAGHSQGGFTVLWAGGVGVNADQFHQYQKLQSLDPVIPTYYQSKLAISPNQDLIAHDPRIKAVFSMAPARIKMIGMDEKELKKIKIPVYLFAAGGDTIAPFADNAKFASENIPNVTMTVIPGEVGHEIFVNECNEHGKALMAAVCVDPKSVDREKIHNMVANEAVKFFDQTLQ